MADADYKDGYYIVQFKDHYDKRVVVQKEDDDWYWPGNEEIFHDIEADGWKVIARVDIGGCQKIGVTLC